MRIASLALLLAACSPSASVDSDDDAEPDTNGEVDSDSDSDSDSDTAVARLAPIEGRFESIGPIRTCGGLVNTWQADDGVLLRLPMNLCGDDLEAMADTLVSNLDAVQARGDKALVAILQGTNLPSAWLADCETYSLNSSGFTGDLCLPWDAAYQSDVEAALREHLGPALSGHPALAGVYFTAPTMTNGVEFHFRVPRDDFPAEPSEGALTDAYLDLMDAYQAHLDVPIVFEGGHCLFDLPSADESTVDCATPLALYRHTRDTYGSDHVALALWNCAERFWWGEGSTEDGVRPLLEEAAADGVSMGCQTVGNFTLQPCRFSDSHIGDYGTQVGVGSQSSCIPNAADDAERACVDTLSWFAGSHAQSATSVQLSGSWVESWSADTATPGGIHHTSDTCRAAVDAFAPMAR